MHRLCLVYSRSLLELTDGCSGTGVAVIDRAIGLTRPALAGATIRDILDGTPSSQTL
jgi:hypothetical protein